MKRINYKREVIFLIGAATIIRSIMAYFIDLSGEEAYCWSFALYPKLSQMESTPMIGWLVQLTTCNLAFNHPLFIRAGAIMISALSTWLIYIIGRRVKSEATGFCAAVLYTSSLFCSVTTGTFIGAETPQLLFLLLSIYFLHEGLIIKYDQGLESRTLSNISLSTSGIFIGLATLSHFSSILIWAGVLLYITLYDKKAFGRPYLYISFIFSLLLTWPVIFWHNLQLFFGLDTLYNHLINTPDPIEVLIENNPVNIIIIIVSILSFRQLRFIKSQQFKFFISISLPLILTGNISTGIIPLFFVAASSIETRSYKLNFMQHFPRSLKYSLIVCISITTAYILQLYIGLFNVEVRQNPDVKIGYYDPSLGRYGMRELSEEFGKIRTIDVAMGKMPVHSYIVSDNYLFAAQAEYYIAYPEKIPVKAIGSPAEIRKYLLTTMNLGGFKSGESAYYLEPSGKSRSGIDIGNQYFKSVEIAGNIYVHRLGKPVMKYTVYRFKDLQVIPFIQ